MKKLFYCIDCNKEFHNAKWDGSMAVCPRCDSTRWYDITKEKKEKEWDEHSRVVQ